MKRLAIGLFIFIFGCLTLHAQAVRKFKTPNYSDIKREIENKKSPNFYPTIFKRYLNNDTTLTNEQYFLLYFGYILQDSYDAFWSFSQMKVLLNYYKKELWDNSDCDSIVKYCKLSLSEFPFDLQQLNMMGFALHKRGNEKDAQIVRFKTKKIFGTIMSTGDGLSSEKAIHVLCVNHEYEVLKMLRLRLKQQFLTKDNCDYMELQSNKLGLSGLYFDVKKILEMEEKSNKFKK